jgi:hypothetical protein
VGTITFKDGATTLCSTVSLAGNTAQCTTSTLSATDSLHSITAEYSGSMNFAASSSAPLSQVVNRKNLTISGANAQDKIYDGDAGAEVDFTEATLVGIVGSDDVSIDSDAHSATFDDKDVGDDKPVTVSGVTLEGADSGNYTVSQPSGLTADITPRTLTVSATADNKEYDGTTDAVATLSDDRVSGDDLDVSYSSATFDTKHVGTGKTVTVTGIAIDGGADAGNYVLGNTSTTALADITAKELIGSFTAADKVYDGNKTATITARFLSGVIGTEDVSLVGGTAEFDTKEVGTGKTVTAVGFSITGPDAGNYTLSPGPWTTTASILAWNALGHGFYQPVGIPNSVFVAAGNTPNPPAATPTTVWNVIKGGQTVPLKFNVFAGTVEQTTMDAITAFTQTKLNTCTSGAGIDELETTLLTTGGTNLRYTESQWIQNWQTPKVTKETCYRATVTFADGSTLSAFFRLKK